MRIATKHGGHEARRGAAGALRFRKASARVRVWLAGLFVLCVLGTAVPALAQELVLSNFLLDNQAGAITVRFSLDMEEVPQLSELLQSGARLRLDCAASLYKDDFLWFKNEVAASSLTQELSYDPLARQYVLRTVGGGDPVQGEDLHAFLVKNWSAMAIDLAAFDSLERGRDYLLDLDVTLEYDDVPAWMRYLLFFWSWNVAPEAMYRMEFQY